MNRVAGLRWCVMSLGMLLGVPVQAQVIAGRTQGTAEVTATGAARYSIPLALPPGTNGLAPSLAITYDSRGGNGLLGVGFRLEGLSAIHRCGSTLAQDGKVVTVTLAASDRFCLDGQRLRLTGGTYGSAGSYYQTEVESFARVYAYGLAGTGPASFRVERRDGLIYEYGGTADSRVESVGSVTPREWALSRIRDRNGNYADVFYTEDATTGVHRPARIDYAGNLSTGAAPYYSVRFTYESRAANDQPIQYVAGGAVSEPARLDRIDVVHVATGRTVRSFDLTYASSGTTARSRLASLQECAGSTCFAPTQFSWSAAHAGWNGYQTATLSAAHYAASIPGDVDGDGFDDLAYQDSTTRQWVILRGGPSGFQYPAINTGLGADSDGGQAVAADLDGDGRRDILVPGSGNYWYWLRHTAAGPYAYGSTGVANGSPPGGLIAADIDGDGRDDLVYVKSAGDAIYWRRNQSGSTASYAAEAVLWTVLSVVRLPAAPFIETAQRFRSIVRSGDFNGDGRVDLLLREEKMTCLKPTACDTWKPAWRLLASTGAALQTEAGFDGSIEPLLADFNGDGLTDLGYWAPGTPWTVKLGSGWRESNAAAFAPAITTAAVAPAAAGRAMVIDWDADGRADILQPTSSGELHYCRSTGTSLETCQPSGIALGTLPVAPITLDVNGDGHSDLMYSTSGVRLHLHQSAPPDLLVAATDGQGARSEFEYSALVNSSVHRAGHAAVFPVRDVARLGHVVSRISRGTATSFQPETYFYEGARVHAQGRGFLGFARVTVTPSDGGPVRVTEYRQDPATVESLGAPSRVTLQQRSGVPISRTTYTWGRHLYGSGYESRSFAYPASVATDRYELDGVQVARSVVTNSVDSYGTTLTRQVTTTERGKGVNPGAQFVETVALTGVVNDVTNWCVGRPASTQVSRSHTLSGGAQVTRSFAHTWDYLRCRPTQQVVEPSSATLRVTTGFTYDSYGNLAATNVTPVGQPVRTTTLTWAENGRFLRTQKNPEGHVETLAWDSALAQPTTVTDPNGLVTTLQYDAFGRVIRRKRPDGTSTVLARSRCDSGCAWPGAAYVVKATERGTGDAVISTVETGFDKYGQAAYTRRDLPAAATAFRVLRFDARGLLSQESVTGPCCVAPTRWVSHSHDLLGRRISTERPTSEADPTPVVTRWRHDGHVLVETDPLGRTTTRNMDVLGRVVEVVDASGARAQYGYDAFGNLTSVRDASGAETVIAYDVRGLRRSISDPNAGRWTFDYLPLGELKSQTNARGQATAFTYDRLSRPLTRTEPEGTTTWTWGATAASRNIGSLASVSSPGFQESYQYDTYGRASTVSTTVAGATFVASQSYDPVTALPDVLTYPASTGTAPLRVRHHYSQGRLVRLSDVDTAATYWQLFTNNSLGQVTDEKLGNGVRVVSRYDGVTGRLLSRTSGVGGGSTHQNLGYAWDAVGNLSLREERNRGVQERFYYDARDRLDYVTRGGATVLDLGYDDTGNLAYKSDVGTYRYDAYRKQAVVAAGANTYAYDANGAVVNASGTTISWSSFDLPVQLTHPSGNYSAFYYGPDRARYRQVARAGGVLTETLYAAGGLFERVTVGSARSYRHYIVADGRRVAVHTRNSTSSPATVYLLEDHQGGVDGFTSASGSLLTRSSYQPFGARRSGDWLGSAPTATEWQQIKATTPRGYTDHEHVDNLGVIHMNGRVYDPALGRFLSPDPLVQAPYDTQGLNRYAYVRNNPLRYTDPSGLCLSDPSATGLSGPRCLEEIVVESSRWLQQDSWRDLLTQLGSRGSDVTAGHLGRGGGSGGSRDSSATAGGGLEEIVVSAPRSSAGFFVPADVSIFAAYNLAQSWMMAQLVRISAEYGENAVNYYIDLEAATGNELYRIPGLLAALWTPETAPFTSLVLGVSSGVGVWSRRPFWQYFPEGSSTYRSTWLTRGTGWSPPYEAGGEAAASLALPSYNPGSAVRAVYPHWYQFVRGPRTVAPQPTFGTHASGGGVEYRIVPFRQ